jgi:hypothetical protein
MSWMRLLTAIGSNFDQAALTAQKAALLLQIAAIMSTVSMIGPATWAGVAAWAPRTDPECVAIQFAMAAH